jgi:F-type H+-transporting ATPase subunit j
MAHTRAFLNHPRQTYERAIDGIFQIFRPLWPFFVSGGIVFYLVSKLQDAAVRCVYPFSLSCSVFVVTYNSAAEAFAKDPRNPYAAQIAKEAHH